MKRQRIGFAVQNMAELERMVCIGADMVEIKLEKFANRGTPLMTLVDGEYEVDNALAQQISLYAQDNDVSVQVHAPIERDVDMYKDTGLNAGIREHHDVLVKRFLTMESIYRHWGIGGIITIHPPTVSFNGNQFLWEKDAIANAKFFYDRLDKIRLENKHMTLIGLENQTDMKKKAGTLGYLPIHFRRILKDTCTIGVTIDSGHRRLASEFSIREFLQLGMPVNNFHFHGNSGVFDPEDWRDDEHLLPNRDNVTGYHNYVRYFRRHRVSIVLEISKLERYSDKELADFLTTFREELA